MFKVTIVEVRTETETPQQIVRYEQTVDVLDMRAVMAAVNQKPRKPRTVKEKTA